MAARGALWWAKTWPSSSQASAPAPWAMARCRWSSARAPWLGSMNRRARPPGRAGQAAEQAGAARVLCQPDLGALQALVAFAGIARQFAVERGQRFVPVGIQRGGEGVGAFAFQAELGGAAGEGRNHHGFRRQLGR